MAKTLEKIGIIANTDKKDAVRCTLELLEWLEERNVEVLLEREIAAKTGKGPGTERTLLPAAVDLMVVFGGTGHSCPPPERRPVTKCPSSGSISADSAS